MALTADQELLEHQLRVEQMQANAGKARSDMAMESRGLAWQTRGIALSVLDAFAGAAWMRNLH